MKGVVKMCCHVSGVTGLRVGGIRAEVKAVVVEGVFTTLLEGKIGLIWDRQMWAGGSLVGTWLELTSQ